MAKSGNLWERRISLVATCAFIRKGSVGLAFGIASLLLLLIGRTL
ncbi:TPA: DNA alkylation repair protein [Candidatus Woesearchaeota archaeon]|nr:DNA alkylation repair protein [Candidatus Woesearchaeota archaeon]